MKPELGKVGEVLSRYPSPQESLIPVLQELQEHYGYLPEEVLREVCAQTGIKLTRILGVASFYAQFRLEPIGKYNIMVCLGTACHVNGGERIADAVRRELGVEPGKATQDGLFSWEEVACLGCCSLSPVMMINGTAYGKLDSKKVSDIINGIREKEAAAK